MCIHVWRDLQEQTHLYMTPANFQNYYFYKLETHTIEAQKIKKIKANKYIKPIAEMEV